MVLLYFRRGALALPREALLDVLLPMIVEHVWVTPQELWELEEREKSARK